MLEPDSGDEAPPPGRYVTLGAVERVSATASAVSMRRSSRRPLPAYDRAIKGGSDRVGERGKEREREGGRGTTSERR